MNDWFASVRRDNARPQVMGILNITPDSFSDGGFFLSVEKALAQALEMERQGASIIDVGGESTRPGAQPVSAADEIARVVPVIKAIRAVSAIPISIDTSKPEVMRAAVEAGATVINDVYALRQSGALETAAELQVPVCLMHMQGEPRSMQREPRYNNVLDDVAEFLEQRVAAARAAGIADEHICLDPGIGFGKTVAHNLTLLKHLERFTRMGFPLLVGVSRKSMLGAILDLPVDARLAGSLSAAVLAYWNGAAIIRAHDVGSTVEALKVAEALRRTE